MSMRTDEVRAALNAGHRQFVLDYSPDVVNILAFGHTWVRYKAPYMTFFMSTQLRAFATSVSHVYTGTEKQ